MLAALRTRVFIRASTLGCLEPAALLCVSGSKCVSPSCHPHLPLFLASSLSQALKVKCSLVAFRSESRFPEGDINASPEFFKVCRPSITQATLEKGVFQVKKKKKSNWLDCEKECYLLFGALHAFLYKISLLQEGIQEVELEGPPLSRRFQAGVGRAEMRLYASLPCCSGKAHWAGEAPAALSLPRSALTWEEAVRVRRSLW